MRSGRASIYEAEMQSIHDTKMPRNISRGEGEERKQNDSKQMLLLVQNNDNHRMALRCDDDRTSGIALRVVVS